MTGYNMGLNLENIRTITVMFADIFLVWLAIYYAIKLVRSNSRTIQIFKGILLVIILDGIAKLLGLKTVAYMTDMFINWGFLAIIVIFQPEIRTLLERIGKSNVFSRITTLSGNEKEHLVDQIVTATMLLSQDQTGALISIEQSHSLEDFIATGTRLNSDVTAELLTSIFVTSTPLHDGAVIIQGDKIACASAYFPPTNLELPSRYGARHRAAIGISEITDAVTIVVSEETGNISIAEAGKIFSVNRKQLRDYLMRVILGEETEVHSAKREKNTSVPTEPSRPVVIKDSVADENIGHTGILLREKLAIKKQDTAKIKKIEVEEVVPAEHAEPTQKAQVEEKTYEELYGNVSSKEDEAIRSIEQDASRIKLPKKKKRPTPSYPSVGAGNRFENKQEPQEETVIEKPTTITEEPMETPKEEAPEQTVKEEVVKAPRMTAEEVAKARERYKKHFSATAQEDETQQAEQTTPVMDTERYLNETLKDEDPIASVLIDQKKMEEESRMYDTSKLDLSKIMGMNDELDKTFEIVDQMKPSEDKKEGGDR